MATFYGGPDDVSRLVQPKLQMGTGTPGSSTPFGYQPPAPTYTGGGPRIYGAPGYDASGQFVGGAMNNAVSAGRGVEGAPPLASNQGGYSVTSSGLQYGSTQPSGAVISQTSTNGGPNAASAALQQQASAEYAQRLADYKNLIASIMGSKGYLGQLGKTGETRIATNLQNEKGRIESDLASRGLGNTTIRENLLAGAGRDAEQSRQALGEQVATQKAGTSMQLFGMNPSPSFDTYLQLLQRMGGGARA